MFELSLLASSPYEAASRCGYIALTHGQSLGAGVVAIAALCADHGDRAFRSAHRGRIACAPHERQESNR